MKYNLGMARTTSKPTEMLQEAYKKIQDSLFDSLETAGKWECPWMRNLFVFHNPLSGHEFSGFVNCAILSLESALRGWTDPRFVTASQVRKAKGDWWIKRDEFSRPVHLFRPRIVKSKKDGEEKTFIAGWLYYSVYNGEQMETAPELVKGDLSNEDRIASCEETIKAMPCAPTIKTGGKAAYHHHHDYVEIPPFESFNSAGEYYSSLFHELAHSTMDKSRLGRDGKDYAREELVAETCAAILCATHGIEGRVLENAKSYVAGWRKRCTEDPKLFGRVMADAMKAAEFITGRVKSHQKPNGEKLN